MEATPETVMGDCDSLMGRALGREGMQEAGWAEVEAKQGCGLNRIQHGWMHRELRGMKATPSYFHCKARA